MNVNNIENKSVDQIQDNLEQTREKNEKGNRYNDEMKIAAKKVSKEIFGKIRNIGKKIKGFANQKQKKTFFDKYKKLNSEVSQITNKLTTYDYLFSHDSILNDIAHKIDNAENRMIKIIEQVEKQKVIKEAQTEENKLLDDINDKNKYFEKNKEGKLILTKNINKPRIDQVLGDLMDDRTTRLIDYSKCENVGIKNKMIDAMGGEKCYIVKGKDSSGNDTYVLKNRQGQKLDQRALIWEGVTLTSDLSFQEKALNNLHNKELDGPQIKELNQQQTTRLKSIVPNDLKEELDENHLDIDEFIKESDNALDKIIVDAKKHGWELRTEEPVSRLRVSGGLMEAHFINSNTTVSKGPILSKNTIDTKLYSVLDSNEGDLKDYLTTRIKQKWDEYEYLTKRENIFSNPEEGQEVVDDEIKDNAIYGLGLVDNLINNLREDKGDTRGKKDKRIVQMQKFVKNALYSLGNGNPTKGDLKNIENKLKKIFYGYYTANRPTIPLSQTYTDIVFGGREKAIAGVRTLSEHMSVWDNSYTTFLRDEIMEEENFEIKNEEYQGCFDKISDLFSIPDNAEDVPKNVINNTDKIMEIVKTNKTPNVKQKRILEHLQSIGILPKSASIEDDKVKEGCEKLYHIFENKNKTIDNLENSISIKSMKTSLEHEKLILEAKSEKTEAEITRLNSLLYILEDSDTLNSLVEENIENIKKGMLYGGIDDEIKGSFGLRLAKEGGGVTGTNSAVFNDSIGAGGWFDRSDENASQIGPVVQMILEEVAICIVAIAAGAVTAGAGTAAIYGARAAMVAAKGVKYGKMMRNVLKFSKYRKYYKKGKIISKAVKKGSNAARKLNVGKKTTKVGRFFAQHNPLTYAPEFGKGIQHVTRGSYLVIEGSAFHLSSTVLHNLKDGRPLSEGLNPNGYTQGPDGKKISNFRMYVQSIAFLGVLKAIGQPVQKLSQGAITKIMGKSLSATQMGAAVKNMTSFGGEVATLMGTEQILSLGFGEGLAPITTEGFIHMLGMVAGLRGYHALQGRGKMMIKEWRKGNDGKSIEIMKLEVIRDGKTYETVLNSKGEVVRTKVKFELTPAKIGLGSNNTVDIMNFTLGKLYSAKKGEVIEVKTGNKSEKFKYTVKEIKPTEIIVDIIYTSPSGTIGKYGGNKNNFKISKEVFSKVKTNQKDVNQRFRELKKSDSYDIVGNKIKIDPIKGETLDGTIKRALKNKKVDQLVVVENGKVFSVYPKITTSKNIEVRLENGVIEKGPRKDGKLDGDGVRISKDGIKYEGQFVNGMQTGKGKGTWPDGTTYEGMRKNGNMVQGKKTTPKGEVYQGEFKLGDLQSGKVIAKNGKVIKEYYKGKEILEAEANFENVKSLEELYRELDRVGEIKVENKSWRSNKTETKYSAEKVKEIIKKGEIKYLPKKLQAKVEGLNNLRFDVKKCSNQAKEFVKEFGEPKNKIELSDGSILHVTDILQQGGGYKFVVGYASKNGRLEPRIFYRSGSEGCRRSCPGIRASDGGLSKAEFLTNYSYETTTKLDPTIGNKFDKFGIKETSLDVLEFSETKFGGDFLENQMKESIKVDKKLFEKYDDAVNFYQGEKSSKVVNGYNNLMPKGLDYKNMKNVPGKEYSYKHDHLGDINVSICRTKLNGKDVDIHFANSKNNNPNQIWIENIVYSDAKINSFGVYNKQINAGPLTAKPIDYAIKGEAWQVPIDANFKTYGGKYMDIRSLYQGNPIIKYAKENVLSNGVNV